MTHDTARRHRPFPYARNPAFIASLKRAAEEVATWPKVKRDNIESLRGFQREQSRRAHEDD